VGKRGHSVTYHSNRVGGVNRGVKNPDATRVESVRWHLITGE